MREGGGKEEKKQKVHKTDISQMMKVTNLAQL